MVQIVDPKVQGARGPEPIVELKTDPEDVLTQAADGVVESTDEQPEDSSPPAPVVTAPVAVPSEPALGTAESPSGGRAPGVSSVPPSVRATQLSRLNSGVLEAAAGLMSGNLGRSGDIWSAAKSLRLASRYLTKAQIAAMDEEETI